LEVRGEGAPVVGRSPDPLHKIDPEGDLNSNGLHDPLDLFLFQRDWLKATEAAGLGSVKPITLD
jgi:hypothetical protein